MLLRMATTATKCNAAQSPSSPRQRISQGASCLMQAGDTLIVMDGTYDNEGQVADGTTGGGSVVTLNISGSAGNPMVIKAQHRGNAILNAASTTESSSIPNCYGAFAYFDAGHAAYVNIEGFVIENACILGIRING